MKNHDVRYKIISLFIVIIFWCSCSGPELLEWKKDYLIDGYDFRKYSEEGFLFTPNAYTGKYESIALIEVLFIPSIEKINRGSFGSPATKEGHKIIWYYSYYYLEEPDPKIMVRNMHELANRMGGDAVTNFKISREYLNNGENGEYRVETVKVSGFVINRND